MATETRLSSLWFTALLTLTIGSLVRAQDSVAPAGSLVGKNERNLQRVLIGPMEWGDDIGRGGWRMKGLLVTAAEGVQPKVGRGAPVFGADAEIPGAKGDFSVHGQLPGQTDALGLWVHLDKDANIELINVHYYSGQNPPETATVDGNTRQVGNTTFVQDLEELTAWRDRHAPKMPIWMTETGYDSAGPFGTNTTLQAARLPRVVMLCLGFGVDKVLVYRESGSTPAMHACSGVLNNDFTEKPSWFTFGTLVRQFRGVQGGAVRLPHEDENVWLLKWNDGGRPLLTAWTVDGNARLGLDLGRCRITDAFGARTDAKRTTDLSLTPFPLYIRNMDASVGWHALVKAYGAQQLELRKRRERAVKRRKHLYDFGGAGRVGDQLLEGIKFRYLSVKAADVWDEARGYGFNMPAMSDENRRWVRSKLDGDGCRMRRGIQFRFRVEPGTYHLSVGFRAHEDKAVLLVEGLKEPLRMALSKKGGFVETDIAVTGPATLSVSHDGYGEIRWLSLIEKD